MHTVPRTMSVWSVDVVLAFGRWRQTDQKLETILRFVTTLRLAWATLGRRRVI